MQDVIDTTAAPSAFAGLADPGGPAWWSAQVALLRAQAAGADAADRPKALIDLAQTLVHAAGDLAGAEAALREAHGLDPRHPGALQALARLARRRDDGPAERGWLERLLPWTEGGDRVGTLARLGRVRQRLGDLAGAFSAYVEAAELAPDDPELLLRARLTLPADDVDARAWVLERLLAAPRLGPDQALLLLGRARVQEHAGEDDAALTDYWAAHTADPHLRPAIDGIIRIHTRHGRWFELVEALRRLAAAVGDDQIRGRLVYLSAVVSATRLDEAERSRALVGQAAMLVADDVTAMLELVAEYEQFEMWGPANLLLESIVEGTSPVEGAAALYRIGLNAEVGLGDLDRALQAYRRAVVARPDHVAALVAMRRVAWRLDDVEAYVFSLERLGALVSEELREAFALHLADVAELRQDDDAQAIRRLDDAIAHALAGERQVVRMPVALAEAHRLYLATESYAALAERLAAVLQRGLLAPRVAAVVHGWLGELHEGWLDDPAASVAHYGEALALDPDNLATAEGYFRTLEATGEPREVAVQLEAAVDLVGPVRGVPVLVRAARIYTQIQDPESLERVWRRVLALDAANLPALRGLGRLLFEARRWPELAELFRSELAVLPVDDPFAAELLERLGALLRLELDAPDEAVEIYEQLRERHPDSPSANAALESLYAQRGCYEELALLLADRAQRIESPSLRATVRLQLARLYHGPLNHPEAAREAYACVLADAPDAWPAIWGTELLLREAGEIDGLVALYQDLFERVSGASRAVVGFKLATLLPPEEAITIVEALVEGRLGGADASLALFERAAAVGDPTAVAVRLAQLGQHATSGKETAAILTEAAEVAEVGRVDAGIRGALWDRVATLAPDHVRPFAALIALWDQAEDLPAAAARWVAWARRATEPRGRAVALWTAALLLAPSDVDQASDLVGEACRADALDPVPAWLTLYLFGEHLEPAARVAVLESAAAAQKSGPVAARWLYEAGRLRAEVLDDLDGALKDFVESVGRDPIPQAPMDAASEVFASRGAHEEIARLLNLRLSRLDDPALMRADLERLAQLQTGPLCARAEAAGTLRRIVELSPQDVAARVRLGDLLFGNEAYADAVAQYEQAIGLSVDDAEISRLYQRVGKAKAYHLADTVGAIEDLRHAVGMHDPDGQALEALAGVYLVAGEAELAQLAFQRLERLVDEDVARRSAARAGQVRALLAAGRREEAAERLQGYREDDPVDPALAALARDLAPTRRPEGQSAVPPPLPAEAVVEKLAASSSAPPAITAPPIEDVYDDFGAGGAESEIGALADVAFDLQSMSVPDEGYQGPLLTTSSQPPPIPSEAATDGGRSETPAPRPRSSSPLPRRRGARGSVDTIELEILFAEARGARRARDRVSTDPLDVMAWQALRDQVETSPVKAAWIDSVLAWIGAEPAPAPGPRRADALPGALIEPLVPDGVPTSALALFGAVGNRLAPLFPSDVAANKVEPSGALYQPIQQTARLLGLPEVSIFSGPGRAHAAAWAGERWSVSLGDALSYIGGHSGAGFLAGRALAHVRLGTLAGPALPDREFRPFLAALVTALGADYPIPARDRAASDRFRASISPLLEGCGDAARDAAAALARDYNTYPATSIRAGLQTLAARVALAISTDFAGSIEMMRAVEYDERPRSELDNEEIQQVIADNEAVRDLVIFAGSRACLAIRSWLAEENDGPLG